MRLLLLSNSTNAGEGYLTYPEQHIKNFLGSGIKTLAFVPYAAVTISYDEYTDMVATRFGEWGYEIKPVHLHNNPHKVVEEADGIIIGGGNTFRLLDLLQETKLIETVKQNVIAGKPYIGWSAGSNVCCPTIQTTNDMPICQPHNFKAMALVPFQINPHYTDVNPKGFAGETRPMRIKEFIEINPDVFVVGLREGTAIQQQGNTLEILGPNSADLYKKGTKTRQIAGNVDFLLK